jgi:hypothetical protein
MAISGDTLVATTPATNAHYVDWGAIILGAVLTTAIAMVLFAFGTGIGLSLVSPYEGEGVSKVGYFIALGLWTLWVIVSSFMAGGYLAGRLRRRIGDATEHEVEVRDGAHGLGVWGLGVVTASLLLALGVSGLVGTAANVAGPAAAAKATDDSNAFTIDSLFRMSPGSALPGSAPMASSTADPAAGADAAAETADDPAMTEQPGVSLRRGSRNMTADRAEVGRLLSHGMVRGELAADNKTYLAQMVAARTGMSQADAERRVNEVLAEAKRQADAARKIGILVAFATAVALLVGGAAATWAAALGGKHRDEETDLRTFWRWH